MPVATHPAHRDFFQKHHFIGFDEVLSKEQAASLRESLDKALFLRNRRNKNLSLAAFDLWREDPSIQKKLYKSSLIFIAAELFQTDKLKIAFDLYLSPGVTLPQTPQEPTTLQALSSLNPLAGGILLQLGHLDQPCEEFPFPTTEGNLLAFSASLPIPWKLLLESTPSPILLLGFGTRRTLFLHGTPDPNASNLKKMGYAFGDTLKEQLHPTLQTH